MFMQNRNKIISGVFLATCLTSATAVHAEDLYSNNFDNNSLNSSSTWGFKTSYSQNNLFGMMSGKSDIYSAYPFSDAYSGSHVMRLNFEGRNAWCNTCGSDDHKITASEISSGCLSTNGGATDGFIYNRTKGFSRWKVTSSSSNSVCFNKSAPSGSSMFGDNSMAAGDTIKIPRKCGVNGKVGGNINRRSDCDLAINYLSNINSSHFEPGEKLARRMYIYIPQSTVLPNIGIKLGYTNFKADGREVKVIPLISVQRDSRLEVDGNSLFGFTQTPLFFKRGQWHYFEEVWTRETSTGASNGTYAIYAGPAGASNLTKPLVTKSGLRYGELSKFSIIGNWQHMNDAKGSIYLDDIAVANKYIGPQGSVASSNSPTNEPADPAKPNPPILRN